MLVNSLRRKSNIATLTKRASIKSNPLKVVSFQPVMFSDTKDLFEQIQNDERQKKIKITNETQLLGAIYNCILNNDTGFEGMVCLNENIGFYLTYAEDSSKLQDSANKPENSFIIPSQVFIQYKKFGSKNECYYSSLQIRAAQFFKAMDLDYSLKLSYREFKMGINNLILNDKRVGIESKAKLCYNSIDENAIESLFIKFDQNQDGFIGFSEFIKTIKIPMCQKRTKLVEEAFNKFDRNKDGLIDLYDIKYWYINTANSFGNLRLINDKINAALKEWMLGFNLAGKEMEVITREEWFDYYMIISCCIVEDAYFDLLLRTCFSL